MKKLRNPQIHKLLSNKYVNYSLLILAGFFIGWLIFHDGKKNETKQVQASEETQGTIWTCAMHPQIRMHEPGKCPICGMDLIPLVQTGASSIDPDAVHLTREAAALANVLTTTVSRQTPVKEVRLYGKVQADERRLQSQVSHVSGRIEKLYVNFTGESVSKGQLLAQIYSPELITAQQELIEASETKNSQPAIYEAAKEKLRQFKLTGDQIRTLENSDSVRTLIEIVANTNGIVMSRLVNQGNYISQGTPLFEIADLSRLWILFDAYESDLQFIKKGDKISFTLEALPGTKYSGTIEFVDPVIDPVTRVAKVRVETDNSSGRLKPEMFATGVVTARLNNYSENQVIPKSAVLWTGKRSIVYVKQPETDEPVFKIREVELGPMLGESYVVISGLTEGEEIVTSGTFSVDAAAQLEGKPSMMNPRGEKTSSMPGMIMPGDANQGNSRHASDTGMAGMNMSGKTRSEITKKIDVPMDFTMQMNSVFDQYIALKNSLVAGEAGKITQAAKAVQITLSKVDMKLLTGDAHMKWMDLSGKLDKLVTLISSSTSIEDQRIAFSEFSSLLYTAVKTFGLMGKTAYYQFCPMALEGKGAYWLSEIKEIRNPYFGKKMLDCGETRETLNF